MNGKLHRAERRVRRRGARASGRIVADCLAWCVAVTFASVLRVDFDVSLLSLHGQLLILPLAVGCHLIAASVTGLYAGRWRVGSFDEVSALARATAIATALLASIDALSGDPRLVPLAAPIGGGIVAFVLTGAVRYVIRIRYERARRPTADDAARVIVFGAGEGGRPGRDRDAARSDEPVHPGGAARRRPAHATAEHHGRARRRARARTSNEPRATTAHRCCSSRSRGPGGRSSRS